MNIKFIWVDNKNDMELCYKLRNDVFTLEQKFDEAIDKDEYDELSNHILVFDNDLPIATARIFLNEDYYKVGRFCVLKEYRGYKIGLQMMKEIIKYIRNTNVKTIKLSAQYHAYKFYEKCGFESVGDIYLEEDVDHILMIYNIKDLNECRKELDIIDKDINTLFTKRMNIIRQVALYKKSCNISVLDSNREQIIIDNLLNNIDEEYKIYYKELIETILKVSKDYQKEIIENE